MSSNRFDIIVTASDLSKEELKSYLQGLKNIRKWAFVLHTNGVKPHYHIFLECIVRPDLAALAACFAVPVGMISEVRGPLVNYFNYLVTKASSYDVVANFNFIAALNRK